MKNAVTKRIHAEVITNQLFGLIGGWLIVFLTQPLFIDFSQSQVATSYSIIFFCWSYLRSFVIRWFFETRI